MNLKTETAVCASQHINALLRQSEMKKIADWGEPCADCKYSKECNYDWLARLKPLFEKANIPIQISRAGGGRREATEKEIQIEINTEYLDEAVEKANLLVELLQEAQQIIDSLSVNSNSVKSVTNQIQAHLQEEILKIVQ